MEDTEIKRMAYIGICKCGSVVAACVDEERFKKETAKFVSDCIKNGEVVERVPVDDVRNRLAKCVCKQEQKDTLNFPD